MKNIEDIDPISNTTHKDGLITWKVTSGSNETVFEDQHKEDMKKINYLFSLVLDEADETDEDHYNYDFITFSAICGLKKSIRK